MHIQTLSTFNLQVKVIRKKAYSPCSAAQYQVKKQLKYTMKCI
ncbi:hypothetical protein PAUR_a4276 [Pseudoalteromonas aurantia 208]|uniref:Uncharacterized protein n=1 Tax=Pseudoalteromonas aurantia 208 TaxID=1314867 RepID=A0ABR9EFE7_9GAMM|nr:hypothetical protein [Pseudoalteromonas aurantia 208]